MSDSEYSVKKSNIVKRFDCIYMQPQKVKFKSVQINMKQVS